ncbi:hypothetical protein BDV26DRAFT_292303 [Aspergillus bertholletiae]|uniref:3-hydroxyacyl-CoA dehydrogenase n=1 Tax=Aspergillus bertholletiae TaxID=1226010 RepID=A0A5N7B9C8_9EURO|nr:hypothetical protein BDV26DRAFT_292303 [Aspergillus bertholletiae]
MKCTWQPPQNYRSRPVVVLGAGVLGRRIGCIWASAGYDVRIRDPSEQQRSDGLAYIQENVDAYAQKTGQMPGQYTAHQDMKDAVANAWLVIEAVPEKLELKIATFAELEALAPEDCILASNSSSYKSSEMIEKVSDATKARILNMHYYMPPGCMIVELMTDGYTDDSVFPFMVERSKEAATLPYVARKQSTGFIFNRLWAAIKREVLTILAEGVSVPDEIDSMWQEMFIKARNSPCKTMDQVGLDTVAFIEDHYIRERGLSSEKTVDFLKRNYLDDGKLGNKSAKGGLYPPVEDKKATGNGKATAPELLVLDVGLSAANPSTTSGEILKVSSDGKVQRVLAPNQALPDGIAVEPLTGRMFWTCMGVPGKDDGAVYSANVDGSGIQTVVPPGRINTPKQLTLDTEAQKLYFCDREGCRVWRCGYDGSDLEAVIDRNTSKGAHADDIYDWCVGITVAPNLGKFYWTQKGPSKSGKGRIFRANITTPEGHSGATRDDIELVLGDLPEPIDLELDEQSNMLYWTDRGEVPLGNALYRAQLNESGLPVPIESDKKYEMLTKHLKEAIGLKLDLGNGHIYLTDLGGNIYRCNMDGSQKEKIHSNDYRAFTGIALL